MSFTVTFIIFALATTAVYGNWVNGTRVWQGSNWQIQYNGAADNCATNLGGCDVDCSNYTPGAVFNAFSGNTTSSTSYTYRFHQFGNTNADQIIINTNNNPAPVYVQIDQSFTVGAVYVGNTGYLSTTGGANQGTIVATIGILYMYAGSYVMDSAFKLVISELTSLQSANVHVGEMSVYKQGSFGSSTVYTDLGFLNSAATTVANTALGSGGDMLFQNPYGSDPNQITAFTCSGSTRINTQNFYTQAPTKIMYCVTNSNQMYFTPALNVPATNQTNGQVNATGTPGTNTTNGTNQKREGNTGDTLFSGGSSTSNKGVQTGGYLRSLLRRKREARVTRSYVYVPYDNSLILSGGQQMTFTQQFMQQGSNPTVTISTCNSQMSIASSQSVSQACPGCQTGCTNGVFVTYNPAIMIHHRTEMDEEADLID